MIGPDREKGLPSTYKEIENFLLRMAITDADPALVVKFKSMWKWPLPCQMVFVLKPFTQTQQTEDESDQQYTRDLRQLHCIGENTRRPQPTLMHRSCDWCSVWHNSFLTNMTVGQSFSTKIEMEFAPFDVINSRSFLTNINIWHSFLTTIKRDKMRSFSFS